MQDTYSQKRNLDSGSQKTKPFGYICPFSQESCTHSESLSQTQTIICDNCEIYNRGNSMDNVTRSDFGTSTKIVFLSDKLHSMIKWR